MYLNFFGLHTDPLSINPTAGQQFWPSQRKKALSAIVTNVQRLQGTILITGPSGIGKTFTISQARALLNNATWIQLVATHLTIENFFHRFAQALQFSYPDSISPIALERSIRNHLIEEANKSKPVVLELEETHRFDPELLKLITRVGAWNIHGEKLVQIILIGQPRMAQLLRLPPLAEFRSQVALHVQLLPLTVSEQHAYIKHRFEASGGQNPFDDEAEIVLHEHTQGVLFRINTLAKQSIIEAAKEGSKVVKPEHVLKAAKDLEMLRFELKEDRKHGWFRAFIDRLLRVNDVQQLEHVQNEFALINQLDQRLNQEIEKANIRNRSDQFNQH